MNIAALVIVYKPDTFDVFKNIEKYIGFVDKLIVWRNSNDDFLYQGEGEEKVFYMGTGENEYIAKPLNWAMGWCYENGFEWLLTMDQDSTWENFGGFLHKVREKNDDETIIYAPCVNHIIDEENDFIEVESVITSGALHNVAKVKKLGGFREDYKIYWVDGEFCYWSRVNNYKIRVLPNFKMKQEFGKASKGMFGVAIANYSAIVYYHLFRNMIWMRREFGEAVAMKTILYTSFIYFRSILFGEKQKIKKIGSVCKGFIDGLFKQYNPRLKKL